MYRRSLAPRFFAAIRNKIERDRADEAEDLENRRKSYEEKLGASAVESALSNGHTDPRLARASVSPRSALFVPCSNTKALKKIASIDADVFILDLEDSVAVKDKTVARDNLIEFVNAGFEDGSLVDKRLIVRVNSPTFSKDTMKFGLSDMDAVSLLGERIEGIAVPKTSAECEGVLRDIVHPDHSIWAFFETPQSILDAGLILRTKFYSVAAMGLNDLSMELQLPLDYHMSSSVGSSSSSKPSKDLLEREANNANNDNAANAAAAASFVSRRTPLYYHMSQVINAARAYGVHPLDGVFNDPTDSSGFTREVMEAKRFGFSGKTLIHPSQIALTHAAYNPTAAEEEWALRVITATQASQGGVAVVDGKMVEELHARMARRIVAYAEKERAAAAEREHASL